jgi:uncharacterized repeat protein (TIGR01451 family)
MKNQRAFVIWLAMLAGLFLSALPARAIIITRTSITNFYTDISGSPSRRCNYVSYTINNNDGVAYSQVWVTASSFSGGVVGLGPTEDGVMNIGSLAAGETKGAFFYLCANTATTVDQSHTITVYNGLPSFGVSIGSASFTLFNVEDTIQANANKVTTVVTGPTPPELGGLVTITVDGDSGTIGSESIMAYTAAVISNWPANAYELYSSSVTLSGGNSGVFSNILWIPPASLPSSSDTHWTARFFLRAVGTTATPTTVSPTAYISSGANTKHTATDPASLPPIDPTDNKLLVGKSATPTSLIGTGVVTFSLTVTNTGIRQVFVDTIVDTMPSFPTNAVYVTGSSTLNGSPTANPNISGQVLTWPGTFTVNAGASLNLSFQARFTNSYGIYTNRAVATVGPSQIDTTQSTADNAPATATVTVTEPTADIVVFKSGATNIAAGSNLIYTLSVTNLGPQSTTNVTVTDTLPAGVTFVSASGGGSLSNGIVRWTVSLMNSNAATNFTLTVTAPSNTMTLTNIVSATSPLTDPATNNNNGSAASSRVITTVAASADLASGKSGPTNVIATSNLTYTISVTNLGPSAATNIVVSDALPAGVTFVSASPSGTVSNNIVTWTVIPTLAAGAVTNYSVTVTAPAEFGSLTNAAIATSPVSDPDASNNNGTGAGSRVITAVQPRADLVVAKSGSTNITASSNIVYTIAVTNLGPSTASNIFVSDALPTGVAFVSASGGGAVSNNLVTWPVLAAMASGTTTNFTVTVTAPSNAGSLTNIASATSITTDPATNNNNGSAATSRVVTTVNASADLSVTKTGQTNAAVATNLTYAIGVTNLGPSTATNVIISDTLPAGVSFVSASGGGTLSNNVVNWSIASLALGGTNFTVTVMTPSNAVTLTNIASATSPIPDITPSNNDGSAAAARVITAVAASADLASGKSGPTNVIASSNLTYTITVTNLGPSVATNVAVSDALPAGVTFVSASSGGAVSNNAVTWPLVPSLVAGATTNFTVTVTAPVEAASLTNAAVVTSPTPDPNSSNNDGTGPASRVVTVVSARADLTVTKSGAASVVASSNLVYTVTVTNLGPSTGSNVVVSDALPAGVAFVSASSGGTVSNNVVTWPSIGAIAGGATTNYTITVSAPANSGSITNIASVASATTDPNAANNDGSAASSRVVTSVSAAADLFVFKSGPAGIPVTSNFTYTVTVTNPGPSTATNVVASDTLPPGATFVSASSGGTMSTGVVTWPTVALMPAGVGTNYTLTLTAPASPASLTNVARAASATFDPNAANNDGSSANSRVITAVGAAGATISGYVYLDANHNGFKDGAETGSGLAGLFAKIFPSSMPAGPAIAAVPVDPATGFYALSNILGGVYHIVIDTGATLSDVTPNLPAGWSGIEMPAQLRTNVAVTPVNLPNQNFGLVNALTLTGRVFKDTGQPSGTANDGVLNGSEAGLASVIVKLTDSTGATTYDTATTDGAGNYALLIPNTLSNGVTLKVVETNPNGFLSSGASVGTTGGTYARTNDTVTFTYASGTAYTGVNFGDVPVNTFAPDSQQSGLPGTFVLHPHTLVAGSGGQVTFGVASAPSPNIPGWSQVIYRDANCNAILDPGEAPVSGAITVIAGDRICLLVKDFIPAAAPMNAQDQLTVTAAFTYTGASPALATNLTRIDVTTVGNPTTAGLTLLKAVDKATALPGETITYTITYANNSDAPLASVIIYDATPAFTTFISATNSTLPTNFTAIAISAPSVGASGAVKWTFTGTLAPGSTGAVEYKVNVVQ